MRPHREPGIRRDASGRIHAYVRVGGQLRFRRFPIDTPLETVRRWRLDTRAALRLTQRPAGTLAADIDPFLRQIADRPRLVAERRQQLEWWAARLGHLRRDAIAPADVRAALAELRQTHAASTCNHYRQALYSLYRALDGRDAPNPVRDVKPFASPAPEVRGLSYDVVQRILAAMSDQGSAIVKPKPRAAVSAAKVRCRVLPFTGVRPSELMRYRSEHWNRTTQTLVVYTGKGGRTRTIPPRPPLSDAHSSVPRRGSGFTACAPTTSATATEPLCTASPETRAWSRTCSDTRMTEPYTLGHVPEAMRLATSRFEDHLGAPGSPSAPRNRAAGGAPS